VLEIAGVALLIIAIAGAIVGWVGQRNARAKAEEAREAAKNAKLALSQSDFLRAAELLRDKDPRKTQAALAFLARACRTDPTNDLAATRLFSLLSQKNWILPLIDPVPHPEIVERAFFNPSNAGATFVTSTKALSEETRLVRIWDTKSAALIFGPELCTIPCDARWLSPKEPLILLPFGKEVRIASLAGGDNRKPTLKAVSDVVAAQFSSDGATILICAKGGEVTTWDAQSGAPINHPIKIPAEVTEISRDGTHVFSDSASAGGRIWKLDFTAGKAVPVGVAIQGSFHSLSADWKTVCTSKQDENKTGEIYFGSTESTAAPLTARLTNKPTSDLSYLEHASLSLDGRRAVSVELRQSMSDLKATNSSVRDEPEEESEGEFVTGQLRLWDVSSGKQIARMWHETHQSGEGGNETRKRANFSPDGLRIASTYMDARSLRLWDGRDGVALNELPCINSDLSSLFTEGVFSPEGSRLITSLLSGDVQVWDVQPTVPLDRPVRVQGKFTKARFSRDSRVIRLANVQGETRDILGENGQLAPVAAEFTTPDSDAADAPDPSGRRRFDQTRTAAGRVKLVEVGDNKGLKTSVILNADHHFKFSRDGTKVFILKEDVVEGTLLSAESGLPARDTFNSCYNAWFSPDGSKIIVAGYQAQGLRVVDLGSGADLIEPLPYTGQQAQAAAFTTEGIVVVYLGESYAEIQRLDFQLKNAPALLADVAEAIAQHKLNDFGVLEAKGVTIPKLRELGSRAPQDNSEPLFASWLKWFLTPRESRTVAPDSTLTFAQYVDKYVEIASDDSLRQAEFLALGNKELLTRLAAGRAKIAARREELRKAGNTNEEH
jgi:WD40 repeat protein